MPPVGPDAAELRVLILSADVGEGHTAAARALREGLAARPGVAATERDGLVHLGFVAQHVIRDGYRFQLRWMPWSYSFMYWAFMHVSPARAIGARVLYRVGRRRVRRVLRDERPDIVVSTHPALTAVLGRLRLRRGLDAVLCVTVTDLADYAVWSSPGADVHLVMHPHVVREVERHAGRGSAIAVQPLVSHRFLAPRDRAGARDALDLPVDGRVVAISGGGWGVGDLAGGVDVALQAGADEVVVLAGRNEPAQRALERRFGDEPRVRVWGFTDQMPELLRAVDVLVHSTGGVTSLEALSCGCPLVAYGAALGHIRVHNRTMERLGLLTVASDETQLRDALRTHLDGGAERCNPLADGPQAAAIVAGARGRVRGLPAWRLVAERMATAAACAGVLLWALATDDTYMVAAKPLRMRPVSHVATGAHDVVLVVRTPGGAAAGLARALAREGVHVTLASIDEPSPVDREAVAAVGDDVLPELGPAGATRWVETREHLHDAPMLDGRRRYLAPPHGLTLGQYVMARSMGAAPLTAHAPVALGAGGGVPPAGPGDILVATSSDSPVPTAAAVERLVAALGARGLRAVPLSALTASSSTSERTAGDVISSTADPTTAASATTSPATPAMP